MQVTANVDHLYGTLTSRMDTIGTFTPFTISFWQSVKLAKQDYEKSVHSGELFHVGQLDFVNWLSENWGIQVYVSEGGNYESDFKIIADDKYTMFMLKYNK